MKESDYLSVRNLALVNMAIHVTREILGGNARERAQQIRALQALENLQDTLIKNCPETEP